MKTQKMRKDEWKPMTEINEISPDELEEVELSDEDEEESYEENNQKTGIRSLVFLYERRGFRRSL